MKQQTFQNHRKMAPKAYYIGLALGLMVLLFTIIHAQDMSKIIPGYWLPILLVFISMSIILVGYFARAFALKAQDRAIRAEENLRHFAIAGKLLDKRLTIHQVIALRFASDEEFVLLAQQAADENLSNKQIKEQIKNWRADDYRI
jgi:hypothetical protein